MKTNRAARLDNFQKRTRLKNAIKKVRKAATAEEARSSLNTAISLLDKYSQKGLLPKRTASRYKSQLTKHVRMMEQA
jgi:ribosomal protein S20